MIQTIKKNIVILGGGISGLSLLWYLKKYLGNDASIGLLEKTSRVGGWIQTHQTDDFLFESGPRSCRTYGNGTATLELIEELGLQDQVITASRASKKRFLYTDKKLQQMPSGFFSFLFSSFTPHLISSLLYDWKAPKGSSDDESVREFFVRRIGEQSTDLFLDALASGIFAGNIRELSAKSCFPQFYGWEKQYGSLLKGALFSRSNHVPSPSSFVQNMQKEGIFSFKGGMESLTRTLYEKMRSDIWLNSEVKALRFLKDGVELQLADGRTIVADHVYSALPASAVASLISSHDPSIGQLLETIQTTSLAVVNLGYKHKVSNHHGFGYLVPSKENERVLGVVWDSSVFPQQNFHPDESRFTVMIGGAHMEDFDQWSESEFLACALETLANHMQIDREPDRIHLQLARSSIPQYNVGHSVKKLIIQQNIKTLSPHLTLLGSSFEGVAINDCIHYSKNFFKL